MRRRVLWALLLAAAASRAAAQRVSLDVPLSPTPELSAAARPSPFLAAPTAGLEAGLPSAPLTAGLPVLAAPAPAAAAPRAAVALPVAAPRAAAAPNVSGGALAAHAGARGGGRTRSDESSRADGDALFDARRLPADDSASLVPVGYRFDAAAGRLLAPQTGRPLTNAQARELRNVLLEGRARRALLRLAHETAPGGSAQRKAALIELNRDALPREALKAGKARPEKERATILRRLASLYRRWLERAPFEGGEASAPAGAEAEEKLGALVAAAAVERLRSEPEGARLLAELRDERGALRLPTLRVLRLDERYGALYTSYGRQLIVSLDYLKNALLPRLPETERPEAAELLATEAGALAYLSRDPARAAALAEAVDATLFHELVHFHQDLERPLMSAGQTEDIPALAALEQEYEAFFRQNLYIHGRLSRPDARLDADRIDDYLRLIDDFDSWKAAIDGHYGAQFLNGYETLDRLAALQGESRLLLQRLAGPADRRSEAASKRLTALERGTGAIAAETSAAAAALAEYRARWPALARAGLRRWAQINEGLGNWPQAAVAQDRLARLAESPSDAASWREKARRSSDRALERLDAPQGLGLDERIVWINTLVRRFNELGEQWTKPLWTAILRDYARKASELRAEAEGARGSARSELLGRAREFEDAAGAHRASLRGSAELNLAEARVSSYPRRRRVFLEWGRMQAEALGDASLIAEFSALAKESPAAPSAPGGDARPLLERLLERVRLDDRGRADERKALDDAFVRLLQTPTGRRYAEEFLTEGLTAVVHFADFPDSKLLFIDGRKTFRAAQAYTDWRPEDYAEVRLNRHYVDGDPEYLKESLPSILGHELLGHGLWYSRAERAGLRDAFHVHELNEASARLIGWAVDYELDGRFESGGAWSYLEDSARYLRNLKLLIPYYAVTFGHGEMADTIGTLRARLTAARREVEEAKRVLAKQLDWAPVLENLARDHGIAESRSELVRREQADLVASYRDEVANAESVVRAIEDTLAQLEAEPDGATQAYLREAASSPFFARLRADVARAEADLKDLVARTPPRAPRPAPSRPAGQITWDELAALR